MLTVLTYHPRIVINRMVVPKDRTGGQGDILAAPGTHDDIPFLEPIMMVIPGLLNVQIEW